MDARPSHAGLLGATVLVAGVVVAMVAGVLFSPAPAQTPVSKQDLRLFVNQASVVELSLLPGIGPALAERIVAGRPYAGPGDLQRVRGIGPATIERIAPYLRFDEPGKDLSGGSGSGAAGQPERP